MTIMSLASPTPKSVPWLCSVRVWMICANLISTWMAKKLQFSRPPKEVPSFYSIVLHHDEHGQKQPQQWGLSFVD